MKLLLFKYSPGFVFLGASVLLVNVGWSRDPVDPSAPIRSLETQKLLVFKHHGPFYSTFAKFIRPLPVKGFPITNPFGGKLAGKNIVGYESSLLFEYIPEEDNWAQFQCKPDTKLDKRANEAREKGEFDEFRLDFSWAYQSNSKGCAINDNVYIIMESGFGYSTIELLRLSFPETSTTSNSAAYDHKDSSIKVTVDSTWKEEMQYHQAMSSETQSFHIVDFRPGTISNHTITNVGCNKIMVVGGVLNGELSNCVFMGTFKEDGWDEVEFDEDRWGWEWDANGWDKDGYVNKVAWVKLKPLLTARMYHVTFKMKDNVYVVGGKYDYDHVITSCERFNMKYGKWVRCEHSLEYGIWEASVVVSSDETFAVITGHEGEGIAALIDPISTFIFSEENGFERMATNLKACLRDHVSLLV